jgi:hypothetical protein
MGDKGLCVVVRMAMGMVEQGVGKEDGYSLCEYIFEVAFLQRLLVRMEV